MGQAKQRGDKQARIQQAQARLQAIMPKTLVCETCQAEITDIQPQDSRNMPGVDGIFVGKCAQCGNYTQAVLGKKEAVEAYSAFMAEHAQQHSHAPALPRIPIQRRHSEALVATATEEEIRASHGIDENATLLGYLVYVIDTQQYLADIPDSSASDTAAADTRPERQFTSNLHTAAVYSSHLKALKASKQITRTSEVHFLFDLEAELSAYSPKKLH